MKVKTNSTEVIYTDLHYDEETGDYVKGAEHGYITDKWTTEKQARKEIAKLVDGMPILVKLIHYKNEYEITDEIMRTILTTDCVGRVPVKVEEFKY